MESYDILLIVLSVSLAISIFVWIVVGVLVLQVLKKLREATGTAQQAVEHVEEFASSLKTAGKATAVGSAVAQITKLFKGRK